MSRKNEDKKQTLRIVTGALIGAIIGFIVGGAPGAFVLGFTGILVSDKDKKDR